MGLNLGVMLSSGWVLPAKWPEVVFRGVERRVLLPIRDTLKFI